jgi:hypothetical protein
MQLDDSNRRYSTIIAGILVIAVVFTFLACACGVWDHKIISNNGIPPEEIAFSSNRRDNIIEYNPGIAFLSISEKCCKCRDTEDEGFLYFDQNIPNLMPLVIDATELQGWSTTVYSYGGYEFVDGYVDIWQKGDLMGTLALDVLEANIQEDIVLAFADIPTEIADYLGLVDGDTLTVDVYTATFSLTDGPIILDSNNVAELLGDGRCRILDDPVPEHLGKWVKLKEFMTWSGCHQVDQQFQIILAYVCMLPGSPTPE